MKLKTTELTALVTKSIRGASNNKMLPITTLMLIEAKANTLVLETTDSVNYLYVSSTIDTDEEFYAVVNAETFSKLISKITSEYVTLTKKNDILEVTGNGTYKLAMYLNEDGEVIKFPNPINAVSFDVGNTYVSIDDVRTAYNRCNYSRATNISDVPIDEYYFGKRVITTDSVRLSSVDINVFKKDLVINSKFVELLCQCNEPELITYFIDNKLCASSSSYTVFCNKLSDVANYPNVIGLIEGDMKFEGECVISKSSILSILDRLALFVSATSQNKIHLTFDTTGITLNSNTNSGVEKIEYISSASFTPFECNIDIELLISQIKSLAEDEITLHYANSTAIKMSQSNVVQILCLSE